MAVILITGASGLLGGNLARDYSAQYDVSGVFHSHRIALSGVKMIGADLTQDELTRRVIGKVQPDLVVHCAAATDVDRCQRDEAWAYRLNVEMARSVATAAAAREASLIHISTDAVFDGRQGGYSEHSEPAPINVYGASKLAGEAAVRKAHPDALIVRTNLFGWNLRRNHRSLAEWFLASLVEGRVIQGFGDVSFSPILVNDLGDLLLELWAKGAQGLLHLGGADCLSKHQFGRELAARFGHDPASIRRSSVDQAGLVAPRPKELCLDSGKAATVLARPVPSLAGGLDRFAALATELGRWAAYAGPLPANPAVDSEIVGR